MAWASGVVGNTILSSDPLSLSFVGFGVGGTGDAVLPTGAQAGDLAVYIEADLNTVPLLALPADHVSLQEADNLQPSYRIAYKILTSIDTPGVTSFSAMASGNGRVSVLVFRPDFTITNVVISNFSSERDTTSPANQTLPSRVITKFPVISIAHYLANNAITSRGSTQTMSETTGDTQQYLKYAIYNKTAYSTQTTITSNQISMLDFGTNLLQSMYLEVS